METRKKDTFSVIIATVTKRKMFHQKPKCYRCILPMKKVSWLDKYSPVIISSPIALVHLHARLDVLTTVFATSFCFINTTHAFFIFIIVKIYFLLNLFHSVKLSLHRTILTESHFSLLTFRLQYLFFQ